MMQVLLPMIIGFIFMVIGIGFSYHSEHIGWEKGWESARRTFKDWDKGFYSGWEAASKRFVDYDLGFKDGWKAAKESEQGPLADINPKDIPTTKRTYEYSREG